MRLSNKQKKAIETIEYFIPDNVKDWNGSHCRVAGYGVVGIDEDRQNDPDGVSAEEAFLSWSERGKVPDKIKDILGYVALAWGHKRMALHRKMWRQDFAEGLLFLDDFRSEPDLIKKIVREEYIASGKVLYETK